MKIESITIHTDFRPQFDLLQELVQWKKSNPTLKILSIVFFEEPHTNRQSVMITYIDYKKIEEELNKKSTLLLSQ